MRWDDLNMGDKSRMIKLAVDSGITDLRTIRDVYNSYAEGGQKERKPISNKLLKDIAYKIGTNDAVQTRGSANILDIAKAVLGKKPPMDDNKYAYIYGTGDRYPEVKEPIKGFDYSKYLNKYGYEGVKNVYGTINPTKEYHIDEEYENLAKELAKHNYHFYDNADDMFLDYDPDVLGYRDDVANFIHQLSLDENNNVVVHDSDVYDFNPVDYEYAGTVAKPLMKLEASLMDRIGTPYIIRQENQPLYFDGALRGSWNIQQHLEDLSDEDIAKITGSGLIEPAFIEGEHPDPDFDPYDFSNGGKIHIKPQNRGKFTALKKRTGHSASWFKAHGTPAQRKMATFALNARKWKHADGGVLESVPSIPYVPSDSIKNYIKSTEAFRDKWYKDGNGIDTVGYGFTGKKVKELYPDGMTRAQADEYFDTLTNNFAKRMAELTPNIDKLTQNQKDALFSYFYNIGEGTYSRKSPKMQQALRDEDWEGVMQNIDAGYNDKKNPGLKKRRDYERALFETGIQYPLQPVPPAINREILFNQPVQRFTVPIPMKDGTMETINPFMYNFLSK